MAANPAADIIDLRALVRKILKRWWWFAITCSIAIALGVGYLKVTPRPFRCRPRCSWARATAPASGGKRISSRACRWCAAAHSSRTTSP
ncbi:MAG: hypothetical protein IPJ85_02375 [Flavobacteriales bacterium]|nr:hypothetical protein [Flavobacteriales bacterium]